MKLLLKILFLQVALVLTVVIAVFAFLSWLSGIAMALLCVFFVLGAILCLIYSQFSLALVMGILAFLASPFGLRAITGWLHDKVSGWASMMRGFIAS